MRCGRAGLTLIELVLGALTLAIALTAILGAYLGQITLNEHARNLSVAVQDGNRVIEAIRDRTSNCGANPPSAVSPVAGGWDAWLEAQNPGKGISSADPNNEEFIVVTCQDANGGILNTDYCGTGGGAAAQMDATGWRVQGGTTAFDPLRITVTVCWRHRQRVVGECSWNGATLVAGVGGADPNNDGVIGSPASLTTLVTCRG